MDTKILDRKITDLAIIMSPQSDQVAIAKENIEVGTRVALNGSMIEVKGYIRKGHRFALRDIAPGEFVRQYGYPFGQSKGIKAGELISPENLDNVVPEADEKKFSAFLHLHNYHNQVLQRQYWSKITKISLPRILIFHKKNSAKNIRERYPGCISVRYHDIKLAKEIEFLYTLLAQTLGASVNGKPPLSKRGTGSSILSAPALLAADSRQLGNISQLAGDEHAFAS